MGFLSTLSQVINIIVLFYCLVELNNAEYAIEVPRIWRDAENDNILYVEARITRVPGILNLEVNSFVAFTIRVQKDITDNRTLKVGPAWDPRMSVSISKSRSDYRVVLQIDRLTCSDSYLHSRFTSRYSARWAENDYIINKNSNIKSLSPSSPKIINPYGVHLKENQNHTFVCTASTGWPKKKRTSLHWQVLVGDRSFVLSETWSRVHSILDRGVNNERCILNSTLTLMVKPEDQGLILLCLLTNPKYNTIKQADKISDCAKNRWCDVTDPFDIVCKNAGTWKAEHCRRTATEIKVYFFFPLAISLFLNLLCCLLCSRGKTKKEQPEASDKLDAPEIASQSSKANRESPLSHLDAPEVDPDGSQWKSTAVDPNNSEKKISLIRASLNKVIGVFHKPVVVVKSDTSLFSEHSRAASSVDEDG